MGTSHARTAWGTAAMPASVLGVNRQRQQSGGCGKTKSKSDCLFHVLCASLRILSRTEHLAYIHSQIESKAVQVKGRAAYITDFHAPDGSGLESDRSAESVFPGQAVAAGRGRRCKDLAASSPALSTLALLHQFAEDLLVAKRNDLVCRRADRKVFHQFVSRSFFQVSDRSQRSERPREEDRIRHRVGKTAFKERSKPVKGMLQSVCPVDAGAPAAEPVCGFASRRTEGDGAGIVQSRVGRAHYKTQIKVAQAIVAGACGCGGGFDMGEVERHAAKHSKVLVEIVAHGGIELQQVALRVHCSLEGFNLSESLGGILDTRFGGRFLGYTRRCHSHYCHEKRKSSGTKSHSIL